MFKTMILSASILMFISCSSQSISDDDYSPLIWSAMLAHKAQKHEEALQYFSKAFEIMPYIDCPDIFHAAKSALILEKDDLAKEYIVNAIKYIRPKRSYYDNFFSGYKDREIFKSIEQNYDEYVSFYHENFIPKSIYDEVSELVDRDHLVRINNDRDNYSDELKKVDDYNINRLIEITRKHGWIDRAWILLWHQRGAYNTDNYIWNHFKPLIDNSIKEGKIKKGFWANFEDNYHYNKTQKQKYGTYVNLDIDDIENVDKRRYELNLPPLWYLYKIYGTPLPEGYKYKKDVFWEKKE